MLYYNRNTCDSKGRDSRPCRALSLAWSPQISPSVPSPLPPLPMRHGVGLLSRPLLPGCGHAAATCARSWEPVPGGELASAAEALLVCWFCFLLTYSRGRGAGGPGASPQPLPGPRRGCPTAAKALHQAQRDSTGASLTRAGLPRTHGGSRHWAWLCGVCMFTGQAPSRMSVCVQLWLCVSVTMCVCTYVCVHVCDSPCVSASQRPSRTSC